MADPQQRCHYFFSDEATLLIEISIAHWGCNAREEVVEAGVLPEAGTVVNCLTYTHPNIGRS